MNARFALVKGKLRFLATLLVTKVMAAPESTSALAGISWSSGPVALTRAVIMGASCTSGETGVNELIGVAGVSWWMEV